MAEFNRLTDHNLVWVNGNAPGLNGKMLRAGSRGKSLVMASFSADMGCLPGRTNTARMVTKTQSPSLMSWGQFVVEHVEKSELFGSGAAYCS